MGWVPADPSRAPRPIRNGGREMKLDSQIMKSQLLQRQAESFLNTTLQCIARMGRDPFDWDEPYAIHALIDKVVLLGDWDTRTNDWIIMKEMFSPFHVDKSYVPNDRMPNYKVKLIKNLPDCQVIIFNDVINCYLPPFLMEVHASEGTTMQQYKERLHQIGQRLPHLKVSLVEYTLDLFCHAYTTGVQRLFRALRKHAYFPYQRTATLYGEEQAWGDKTRMNMTYRVSDVKMYERGPDRERRAKYWNLADTDRVRLEHTARRKTLVKYWIHVLNDFVERPQFHTINGDIFVFKCFDGSKKLPHYWNAYGTPDAKGNGGCFQLELNRRRHDVKNIHQYMRDVHQLDALKSELERAMIGFDSQWEQLT